MCPSLHWSIFLTYSNPFIPSLRLVLLIPSTFRVNAQHPSQKCFPLAIPCYFLHASNMDDYIIHSLYMHLVAHTEAELLYMQQYISWLAPTYWHYQPSIAYAKSIASVAIYWKTLFTTALSILHPETKFPVTQFNDTSKIIVVLKSTTATA